jgi:hypothetical protein
LNEANHLLFSIDYLNGKKDTIMRKYVLVFIMTMPFLINAMDEKIKDLDKNLERCIEWCNNQYPFGLYAKLRGAQLQDLKNAQFCSHKCTSKYLGQIIVASHQMSSQNNSIENKKGE